MEAYTMKQGQHTQGLFDLAGFTTLNDRNRANWAGAAPMASRKHGQVSQCSQKGLKSAFRIFH